MAKIFFTSNIEAIRKAKGMTQEAFADFLGVSRSGVSSWEEYRSCAKISVLIDVCSKLNMTVDDMLLKDLRGSDQLPSATLPSATLRQRGDSDATPAPKGGCIGILKIDFHSKLWNE